MRDFAVRIVPSFAFLLLMAFAFLYWRCVTSVDLCAGRRPVECSLNVASMAPLCDTSFRC
uniref:Uncharacterized protein n=1 Tax=Globisporangium ultimum (strain ATCC 200006 / CBS 805.95 / DAOM BR144) TaxID=431595 RepID=K3X813_GLOUD